MTRTIKTALVLIALFLYLLPIHRWRVSAGCFCKPVGNDYNNGVWVSQTGSTCNTNYGVCMLNCVISEFNTAKCIKRCFEMKITCNPLTESYIDVGFQVPTISMLLGNIIRLLFFIAGLFALFNLLMGGLDWVQSAGDEKKLEKARGKIVTSVVGLVVMIATLSLVVFLEQVLFGGKICLGVSCPMNIALLRLIGN